MMKYLDPNPIFHIIAFLLFIGKYMFTKGIPSIGTLALLCMYTGFAMYPSLIEFSFLPYYIITFYGFRNRNLYVFVGSILVGIHLVGLNFLQLIGHVLMNFGRSIECKPNALDFALVHLFMFVYQKTTELTYVEYIAAISAFLSSFFHDSMDLFSSAMMFNSMDIVKVLPLHIMELEWYKYFKNNHFKRVYNSYNFILPLGIYVWVLVNNYYSSIF